MPHAAPPAFVAAAELAPASRLAGRMAATCGDRIDLSEVTLHALRQAAISWAMQAGADKGGAAGRTDVSLEMPERVYGHHHPDHLGSAVDATDRGHVGAHATNRVARRARADRPGRVQRTPGSDKGAASGPGATLGDAARSPRLP